MLLVPMQCLWSVSWPLMECLGIQPDPSDPVCVSVSAVNWLLMECGSKVMAL